MLLTILIPTRNRAHRVFPLVSNLLANLPGEDPDLYEIVVLNNASEDDTVSKLATLLSDRLRVIVNEEFFPTSEQNVFNGIKFAKGEFVWFLGDDDLPRLEGVLNMFEHLKEDASDLFIFNFRPMSGEGQLASLGQVRGISQDCDTDLPTLVRRVGMINMLSGWSLLIARRSMLNIAITSEILAVSPIYAHCFWFIYCFSGKRVRVIEKPLIDYRILDHQDGWERHTEKNSVGYYYYWHLGVLRLFRWAVEKRLLTYRDISQSFEYRHDGTRYRAVSEIVGKLIEQADIYLKTGYPRNLMSRADFKEACDILLNIDLSLQDILARIGKIYDFLWNLDFTKDVEIAYCELRNAALELISLRQRDLYEPYFVEYLYSYIIYHVEPVWIAVRVDAVHLIDSVFAQFNPQAMPPGILVEKSYEQLKLSMRFAPAFIEPVGKQPEYSLSDSKFGERSSHTALKSWRGFITRLERIALMRQPDNRHFDEEWYLRRNPDVQESQQDPYYHYLKFGTPEGRNPNPLFSTNYYLKQNADVVGSGVNPLLHFISRGAKEGRRPHPLFSVKEYIQRYPIVD